MPTRFRTDGSASTWPKSGLIAASSVRFDDKSVLDVGADRSRAACARSRRRAPRLAFDCTEYGMSSRRRGLLMPVMPCTSPNCDARPACERRHTRPARALVGASDLAMHGDAERVRLLLRVAKLAERNPELGHPPE